MRRLAGVSRRGEQSFGVSRKFLGRKGFSSPILNIFRSFWGGGAGLFGLHPCFLGQRSSVKSVERLSRILPRRLAAGRLAGKVALSLTTSRSPGSRSPGSSVNE